MNINGIEIDDTFAEAFGMTATRLLITAHNKKWCRNAAESMTGFATSVIGCGVEAGIEREWSKDETPDGRNGISVLLFGMSTSDLAKQFEKRVGQCVLTCPTTAIFSGIEDGKPIPLGKRLRFFGDGHQISKMISGKRYWRVPVMDGEFLCEESAGSCKAVGGGNFLVLAEKLPQALQACEHSIEKMRKLPNVIMPFPGGVVRSGSKVGSKYKSLIASTNDAFCPTLTGQVKTELTKDIGAVLEIVIDGLTENDVAQAMTVGIRAACSGGANSSIKKITAGNYGGKLGKHHFHLHELLK
ncbi:MAG: formylmethanofuran--tetrahydromethanopterin N-formyltransferase [Gammaproteobacteria bacterium]|nr:formylmethanofuran--tetrahydromethanopterin N-formyltransferase [Gammaproteobacteria bacterium]